MDDDAPEMSVIGGESVTENVDTSVTFSVSAEVSPNALVTVYYLVFETSAGGGDFLNSSEEGDQHSELDFRLGVKRDSFTIPIESDNMSEDDATISVTLQNDQGGGTTYTVGSQGFSTVEVIDDDSLPIISIVADNGNVAEHSGPAEFLLTATGLSSTTTLDINAIPTELGSADFLSNSVEDIAADFSVVFSDPDSDNTYTGELLVALDNDTNGEATGEIKLTLNVDPKPSRTYRLSSATEGTITILDDDAPELEIEGVESVTEAENVEATFRVSANVSPNEHVRIYYTVSEVSEDNGSGDFLSETEEGIKNRELDFRSDATSVSFTIPIVSDAISENNSTISVQLTADQNSSGLTYTVGSPNVGEVGVVDDDTLPIVSIIADSGRIAENSGQAKFMLTATGLSGEMQLNINATPTEMEDDFLRKSVQDTAISHPVEFTDEDGDDIYTGELFVSLDDDRVGEVTGQIKLTLNADPEPAKTYRIGSETQGVLTILDDDAPELSIVGVESVTEAEDVVCNI